MESLTTFIFDLSELGHIRAEQGLTGRKYDIQESGVVLHSFYIRILSIILISSYNWKVWPKVKLSVLIWLELSLIRAKYGLNGRKHDFQEPGVVLHSFDAQILSIKLISTLNWEVWPKPNFQLWLASTRPYKSWIMKKHGENSVLKSR